MIRYFAYGSNLWIEQMLARLGPFAADAEPPRIARLANYRLTFEMRADDGRFYANISPPGGGVTGAIYCCTPDALETMDTYETGYHRQRIEVVAEDGEIVEAIAYIADPDRTIAGGRPSAEYLGRILRGARQHGLPDACLREIEAAAGN